MGKTGRLKSIRYWDTLEGKRQEKVNKLYEHIDGGMTLLGTENGEHDEKSGIT